MRREVALVCPVEVDQLATDFYLVRHGDCAQALAICVNDRLFCYVPNVDAFVYNKPLSIDFLIDRYHQYDRIDSSEAARIMQEGRIGRIDDRGSETLADWSSSEPRRLSPRDVFHGWTNSCIPEVET